MTDTSTETKLLRLLASASDEDFTRERVKAIEDLLMDDPALQEVYEDWVALDLGLELEFGIAEPTPSEPPLLGDGYLVDAHSSSPRKSGALLAAVACGVIAAMVTFLVGSPKGWSFGAAPPQVTRTEGLRRDQPWPQIRLASLGRPVWLVRLNNQPVRGYIVPLPVGCDIEAIVDSSDMVFSRLEILELDAEGNPIREAEVFTHDAPRSGRLPRASPIESAEAERFSRLGEWADTNLGEGTRYFLFAASHQPADRAGPTEVDWRPGDFSVLIDEPHELKVGWNSPATFANGAVKESRTPPPTIQRDFNDVTLSIRVRDTRGSS